MENTITAPVPASEPIEKTEAEKKEDKKEDNKETFPPQNDDDIEGTLVFTSFLDMIIFCIFFLYTLPHDIHTLIISILFITRLLGYLTIIYYYNLMIYLFNISLITLSTT